MGYTVKMCKEKETETMYAIWIVGGGSHPHAIFWSEEAATDWARENYFGQWLMKAIELPYIPMQTEEEWAKTMKRAEVLIKKLKPLPQAED